MLIRPTELSDLPEVMDIYENARAFMRESGNMVQWTNGYPGEKVILADIDSGCSYVCADDKGDIAAVFSLVMGEDPTYSTIYEGRWLNDRPYGTVHRIAAGVHNRGVAAFCLDWCLNRCGNVRIDTHEYNRPMRKLLQKLGFHYCGVIYLPDGSPRLAFQKSDS